MDKPEVARNDIFFVGDEPYCLWGINPNDSALRFLRSFDVGYFDYLLETHINAEDEDRAALAIRSTYHHGMETLFSLLGALLQAPQSPHAWIAKCTNKDLGEVVKRIAAYDSTLRTGITVKSVSWEELARASLYWYKSGTSRQEETIPLFADLWRKLASDFIDANRIDEYNSIKHGMRVSPGGVEIHIGIEKEYGVPAPEEEMNSLGASKYGTSFIRVSKASATKGDRSLVAESVSLNWQVEKIIPLVQLISISIGNIVSTLRILNGEQPSKVKFDRPKDDEGFSAPWKVFTPLTNVVMREDSGFQPPCLKKAELLERLRSSS